MADRAPMGHGGRSCAHNSASSPHLEERVIELFLDNLRRLVRGEELLNVVDKRRGY